MIQIHFLTDTLRVQLKSPLGTLLKGSFSKTTKEFEKIVEMKKPSMIISVGDALSKALIKQKIFPKVLIVDHKVMRKPVKPFPTKHYETIHLKNDPGTISDEAWVIIESAVKQKHNVKIVVEGEEDLLTLVAVLQAPENALVVYGQPHEGMVVVEVNAQKKEEIRDIVNSMKHISSKS